MIFPDYDAAVPWIVCATVAAFALLLFRLSKGKRKSVRIGLVVASTSIGLLATLLTAVVAFFSVFFNETTRSKPIWSPDRTHAVVVVIYDAGALGGGSSAVLYSHHRLWSNTITSGNWRVIDPEDVTWKDSGHLQVRPAYADAELRCWSTHAVTVSCLQEDSTPVKF